MFCNVSVSSINIFNISKASFGTRRVAQKRRYMLKILHPIESSNKKVCIDGKIVDDNRLSKSLLCHGAIRRLVYSNTFQAQQLASTVDWSALKSPTKGVRWHPTFGWLAQFVARDYQHNFFVNCRCIFSVEKHGFEQAKQLAVDYRRRLEFEYSQLKQVWKQLDERKAIKAAPDDLDVLQQPDYILTSSKSRLET